MDIKSILEAVLPFVIEVAEQICDSVVKGEDIGTDGVRAIQSAYYEAHQWAAGPIASSKTTLDDDLLAAFFAQCEDAAAEGGFTLPSFD